MQLTIGTQATRSAAGSRFKKYTPEYESTTRQVTKSNDPQEEMLTARLGRYFAIKGRQGKREYEDFYFDIAREILCGIECSQDNIQKAAVIMAGFSTMKEFGAKAGLFLNAMIYRAKEEKIVLHLEHLDGEIHYLGRKNNGKRIEIFGSLGNTSASAMESGELIVRGDVGVTCAHGMKGGKVLIYGNAGDHLASSLSGGLVHCMQNTGQWAGIRMKGGVLRVSGNAGTCAVQEMSGGEAHFNKTDGYSYYRGGGKVYLQGREADWYGRDG